MGGTLSSKSTTAGNASNIQERLLEVEGDPTKIQQYVANLIERIDRIQAKRSWSDGYFGKKAVGDDLFMPRLRGSLRVQVKKLVELELFVETLEGEISKAESAEVTE